MTDLQHAANWQSVIKYNSALRRETVPVYVQFIGSLPEGLGQSPGAGSVPSDVGLIPAGNKHTISVSAASQTSFASVPLAKPPSNLQQAAVTTVVAEEVTGFKSL